MSVPANELESTFCSILGESQSKNTGEGHWLCHPVGNQGCTIAKFLRSKDCQHVLNVRKKEHRESNCSRFSLARQDKVISE